MTSSSNDAARHRHAANARGLRALQLTAVALLVASNLAFLALALTGVVSPSWVVGAPFSLLASAALAVLLVRVQRVAHGLGGPAPVSALAPSIFWCTAVSFIGLPFLLYRTGQAVAATLDDDSIRVRSLAVAWAVGLAPVVVGVGGRFLTFALGLDFPLAYLVVPFVIVLVTATATQVVAAPLIDELHARRPLDGVDGATTPAAIRSL